MTLIRNGFWPATLVSTCWRVTAIKASIERFLVQVLSYLAIVGQDCNCLILFENKVLGHVASNKQNLWVFKVECDLVQEFVIKSLWQEE